MGNSIVKLFAFAMIAGFMFACVPARKYEDELARRKKCDEQNAEYKTTSQQQLALIKELTSTKEEFEKRTASLRKDTSVLGTTLRKMQSQYDKINGLNNELIDKLEKLKTGSLEESRKQLSALQRSEDNVQKRELELKTLEKKLDEKEKNLNELSAQLKESQKDLIIKQQKLEELQSILNKKDSVVKALKTKVSDALLGFENKGLTIQSKNGKVYVSMEEALLFASGSFTVNKRGAEALKKIALVLESNPDINVLVEGHTDNVPYKSSGQLRDNWDLSVMRATTIIKIIIDNSKVDPARLTAAGRSQYAPVDVNSSSDGRAKNRRTEIILTPKLDELFKIIETN